LRLSSRARRLYMVPTGRRANRRGTYRELEHKSQKNTRRSNVSNWLDSHVLSGIKHADAAVFKALVPVCVARAQMDPESGPLLQELGGVISGLGRRSFVEKADWANMPGDETSDRNPAHVCAQALKELTGRVKRYGGRRLCEIQE